MSKPGNRTVSNGAGMKHNQKAGNGANPTMGSANRSEQQMSAQTAKPRDDLAMIDTLAAEATPKQMRQWIARLEALYEKKKAAVRKELTEKVGDLLEANGYTIEELFGARQLPTTADLAARAKAQSKTNGKARHM